MTKKFEMHPLGFRVRLSRKKAEEVTEGGIILTEDTKDKEGAAETRGVVVAIGNRAWTDKGDEKDRCEVGDTVMIAKYSGTPINKEDKCDIIVNDRDIIGKLVQVENYAR
tara:strand:+ start:469 stop:798 length:330 start_codon:yes stop_codon:yes gene_type:complete